MSKAIMLIFWLVLLGLHVRLGVLQLGASDPSIAELLARGVFVVLCSVYVVANVRALIRIVKERP